MYGNNPLYNQLVNPYMQANAGQNVFQQTPRQEVIKVSGENGARAYPMGANSSALLLDESGRIVWVVTTDGAGYKTVMPYDITPHKQEVNDYSTLEQRIQRLEERVNGYASDITTARNDENESESELISDKRTSKRS